MKFFAEFKKFIARGNVVDMAVGVIVGSAFTAIVNGLSNFVLKPIVNWLLAICFGANSLDKVYTFLLKTPATNEAGEILYELGADGAPILVGGEKVPVLDLAKSIYIDWGSFINAVINFFLIAFVLFTIMKVINTLRDRQQKLKAKAKAGIYTREQRKELKANGIKWHDRDAAEEYFASKARAAAEAEAKAKAEAEEKARLDRLANPTTEDLLKQILEVLTKENA